MAFSWKLYTSYNIACVCAFEFESSPFICDISNFKRNYRFLQTSHTSKMAPHDGAISCLLSQHWRTHFTRDSMLFTKNFINTCSLVVTTTFAIVTQIPAFSQESCSSLDKFTVLLPAHSAPEIRPWQIFEFS